MYNLSAQEPRLQAGAVGEQWGAVGRCEDWRSSEGAVGDVEEQCMGRCGGAVGKMWRSMEKQEQ